MILRAPSVPRIEESPFSFVGFLNCSSLACLQEMPLGLIQEMPPQARMK